MLVSTVLWSQNSVYTGITLFNFTNEPIKKIEDNYKISYFFQRAEGKPEIYDESIITDQSFKDMKRYFFNGVSLFIKKDLNYFPFLKALKPVYGLDLKYMNRINGLEYNYESEFLNDTMFEINGLLTDESQLFCLSFLLEFNVYKNDFFDFYIGLNGGYGISFNDIINEKTDKTYFVLDDEYAEFKRPVESIDGFHLDNEYKARSYFIVQSSVKAGIDFRLFGNYFLNLEIQAGYFDEGSFSGAKMGYNFIQYHGGVFYRFDYKKSLPEE